MSTEATTASTDLIRWTFTVPHEAVIPVLGHLADLGSEVFVRAETFHVFWEETDVDLDVVVEAIWDLAGVQFEITQEEFHRLELHILHPEEEQPAETDEETEFHPDNVNSLEVRDL